MPWIEAVNMGSVKYICGWCDYFIAASMGYHNTSSRDTLLIYPNYDYPTFIDYG